MSIPSYTFFSILMKSCTCGKMIGCYQKEIEENIEQELLNTLDLREAKLKVLKNMGFNKICCLDKIINCPKVTISLNRIPENFKIGEKFKEIHLEHEDWDYEDYETRLIEYDEIKRDKVELELHRRQIIEEI